MLSSEPSGSTYGKTHYKNMKHTLICKAICGGSQVYDLKVPYESLRMRLRCKEIEMKDNALEGVIHLLICYQLLLTLISN